MNNRKPWDIPTFVISIDTELAWGSFDHKDFENIKWKFEGERKVINKLLSLLEKYTITATWAIVGHLFLDSCSISNGIKHREIIRPQYSWYKKDWFEKDPTSNIKDEPIWYGKDIVEWIRNSKTEQEIACHSFSHIIFGDPGCSAETAESDIGACINIAQEIGMSFKSFIFPRNAEGCLSVLKQYGFTAYRGMDKTWFYDIQQKKLQKIFHYLDELLMISPRSVQIEEPLEGLFNIPGSMLYLAKDGVRSFIPVSFRVKKAKKGIDKAIKNKEIFHLWFHPFNLVGHYEDKMLSAFEEILQYANVKKKEGILKIMTMQQIVERYTNGR
ncbi:MAG: polysaccharide deacetylase family protein [Deltaproteobacteria bacterium]|nr:polysaccharide deacetylase family protein [Deltaproteobacteria bacterium]